MNYLAIYLTSTSKKYYVYDQELKEILSAHFEHDFDNLIASINNSNAIITNQEYKNSLKFIIERLGAYNILLRDINAIALRISLPGEFFIESKLINNEYIKKIHELENYLPIYTSSSILDELDNLKEFIPESNVFGISDTNFHKNMPYLGNMYALPKNNNIHKFGSHGIILKSILKKVNGLFFDKKKIENIIVCNIDDSCSVTAIKNGISIDHSMGFTEFDGIVGPSSSGNIDTSALLFLAQEKNFSWKQLNHYLTHDSGLKALQNETGDIRLLLYLQKEGNLKASQAIEYLCYNIKKYIGAYMTTLGKLDLLVFTGIFGYRYPILRSLISFHLDILGIKIDPEANLEPDLNDGFINSSRSEYKILTIEADPMSEMVFELKKFLN